MVQGEFQFSATVSKSKTSDVKPKKKVDPVKTPRILTVTQVTRLIKKAINEQLPDKLLLQGEISNFKHHVSGHLYLTLKDDNTQLQSVMWKTAAAKLKFKPADGLAVIATGRVDVFEPHGKYQFYIDKLEPAGLGALELAFRQLAEKLRAEGLFDEAGKKPLPPTPRTEARDQSVDRPGSRDPLAAAGALRLLARKEARLGLFALVPDQDPTRIALVQSPLRALLHRHSLGQNRLAHHWHTTGVWRSHSRGCDLGRSLRFY